MIYKFSNILRINKKKNTLLILIRKFKILIFSLQILLALSYDNIYKIINLLKLLFVVYNFKYLSINFWLQRFFNNKSITFNFLSKEIINRSIEYTNLNLKINIKCLYFPRLNTIIAMIRGNNKIARFINKIWMINIWYFW